MKGCWVNPRASPLLFASFAIFCGHPPPVRDSDPAPAKPDQATEWSVVQLLPFTLPLCVLCDLCGFSYSCLSDLCESPFLDA